MAQLLSKTDRYSYIRVAIDAVVYAHLVRQFGGNDNRALRAVRETFTSAVLTLAATSVPTREPGRAS